MDNMLKEDLQKIMGYMASPLFGKDDLPSLNKEIQLANSLKDSLYYGSRENEFHDFQFVEGALRTTNKLTEACDLISANQRKREIAEKVFECYALAAVCDDKMWSGEEKPINLTNSLSNANDALNLCGKDFLKNTAAYHLSDLSGLALMGDEKTTKAFLDLNKTFLQKGMQGSNMLLSGKASIPNDWYESMEKIALKYPSLAPDCIRQVRAFATCDENRLSATSNGSQFFGVILNDERFSKTDKLLAKSAKTELDNEHFQEHGFIPNENSTKEDWKKHIKFMETGEYEAKTKPDSRDDDRFSQMEKEYSKSTDRDKRWDEYTKSAGKQKGYSYSKDESYGY